MDVDRAEAAWCLAGVVEAEAVWCPAGVVEVEAVWCRVGVVEVEAVWCHVGVVEAEAVWRRAGVVVVAVAGSREGELVVVSRILFRGVGAPCSAPDPEAQPFSRVIGPYDNMGILSLRHGPTSRIPDSLRVQVTLSGTPLDLGLYLQISFWVEARGVPGVAGGAAKAE